ncbi:DNA polymerase delta subunit 4-like [Dysidea avara]|uniref:DNA polymerase delta subunit 4-like n=1 Tax=Dysidea avara TaxID=196820 RepID=UPI00332E6A5D
MSTKAKAKQRKLDLPSAKKRPFKKKGTSLKDSLPKETARKDLIDSTKPEPDVLTQEHLHLLKSFDHNPDFGPCIGITRLQRWNRAKDMQLDPPQEVLNILTKHPENYEVQECLWSKHNL